MCSHILLNVVIAIHLMLNQFHLSFESGIIVVLNVVVCPARKELRDFRPSITKFSVSFDDKLIFFLSPLVLLDVRVQVVVPS